MYKEITILNKKIKVKIDFDCLDDEVPAKFQEETLENFLKNTEIVANSLPEIVKYCLQEPEMKDTDKIENIFKYITPKILYVPNSTTSREVAILCDYTFDKEHGIAIVFKDEKFKGITVQDDVI